MLIPAVDYFSRAVAVAERDGSLSGDLLSEVSTNSHCTLCSRLMTPTTQAAEASMSLGNVSYSHQNEQYFQRAIRYLRTATRIPGYQLCPYLQRYVVNISSHSGMLLILRTGISTIMDDSSINGRLGVYLLVGGSSESLSACHQHSPKFLLRLAGVWRRRTRDACGRPERTRLRSNQGLLWCCLL